MFSRTKQGNMLILVSATILGIFIVLLVFMLGYTRIIGSSSEQKTAIEAAALAAARDLSTIVIDTPEFGFVGLSDSAPTGSNTVATDHYCTPVTSINTLIGTARLDMVIADQMTQNNIEVPEWTALAQQDLANTKVAAKTLVDTLKEAIKKDGSALDKDGKTVRPYNSAQQAYMQNQIRMTGSSNYVAGSMLLSLGAIPNRLATNIPVPNPPGIDASINSTNSVDNCYRAYLNIPYNNNDFYFAGVGGTVRLVDAKDWVPSIPAIPADFFFPTVVRAEAVQNVSDTTGSNNLKAVACAMPASVHDPKPAPGVLTFSFPDGMPDKDKDDPSKDGFAAAYPWSNKSPGLAPMYFYRKEMKDGDDESDYYHSTSGDYPTDTASHIEFDSSWPLGSFDNKQKAATCCKLAVYDWIRRAGTKADVLSVIGMHTTPFLPQGPDVLWPPPTIQADRELIPAGIVHIYRFEPDGAIYYEAKDLKPTPFSVVSEDQILIECHEALKDVLHHEPEIKNIDLGPPIGPSTGKKMKPGVVKFKKDFDMYIRLYSRNLGDGQGGQHAGEPLDDSVVVRPASLPQCRLNDDASKSRQIALRRKPFSNFLTGSTNLQRHFITSAGAKAKGAKGKAENVDKGALPTLGPREDFMFVFVPGTPGTWDVQRGDDYYRTYSSGSGFRPSYTANGIAVDIRFRRVFEAKEGLLSLMGSEGYVVDK